MASSIRESEKREPPAAPARFSAIDSGTRESTREHKRTGRMNEWASERKAFSRMTFAHSRRPDAGRSPGDHPLRSRDVIVEFLSQESAAFVYQRLRERGETSLCPCGFCRRRSSHAQLKLLSTVERKDWFMEIPLSFAHLVSVIHICSRSLNDVAVD